MWAVMQLIRILLHDTRVIVTSLSLDLARLNEYLQQKYGDKAPDVFRRVVLIDKEQAKNYWRCRGVKVSTEYGWEPQFLGPYGDSTWCAENLSHGVVYILDEVQRVFGAREWSKTGPEFLHYQAQHRHYGDDVIAVTPSSSLIEKQFRLLSGECVVLKNFYKVKVGMLKAPRRIVYQVFENCPPMPGEEPTQKGSFTIDAVGLASCYNTAAGLGVVGGQADKGREARGIPWYYVIPGAIVAGLAIWFTLSSALNGTVKWGLKKMTFGDKKSPAVAARAQHVVEPIPLSAIPDVLPKQEPARVVFHESPKLKLEELPACYGDGQAGDTIVLETELGNVYGKHLVKRGLVWELDGQSFAKRLRPKKSS